MAPAQESGPVEPDFSPTKSSVRWGGRRTSGMMAEEESSGSEEDDLTVDGQGDKSTTPLQKRRRVTRACDECRRKKIKCDGKQPCTHCTVYSYECSYDQPSNRRRNPAPQYIEAIENRLHRAEALLKTVLPDVNLDDPTIKPTGPPPVHFPQPGYEKNAGTPRKSIKEEEIQPTDDEKESLLESMVQNTGSLDLDDQGYYDFSGHSSGFVFLKRLKEQYGDIMGDPEGYGALFTKTRHFSNVIESPRAFDSPQSEHPGFSSMDALPSKECAMDLTDCALKDGLALMRFIHLPTMHTMLQRIYDTPPSLWGKNEHRYLPLLYAVFAVGSMFATRASSKLQHDGYDAAIDSGFKYFKASRQMLDITDCRDLPSLQAVVCMILFLQASAKLSVCYSYVGIAIHSAIRLGLHRNIRGNFDPIETEIRKRLFWQIRKMGIYVGAMLGYPIMLNDDDVDQVMPEEVDDDYLTVDGILPMPADYTPLTSAMNAHTRLIMVHRKVVQYIYPLKGIHTADQRPRSYSVSHAKIREIERDLSAWMDQLPDGLRPSASASPELQRVQQLLRVSYAHVQLFTYRPFLHYASHDRHKVDKRSYACAAACVSVARNIVHITAEMSKRGLLEGAYWFTMYTSFTAILTLAFFVLENPQSSSSKAILKDATDGREILSKMATRSMSADRCNKTLATLFDHLEKHKLQITSFSSRKRHASPDPRLAASKNAMEGSKKPQSPSAIDPHPKRASTFPNNPLAAMKQRPSYPFNSEGMLQSGATFPRGSADLGSGAASVATPDSTSGSSFAHSPAGLLYGVSTANMPDLSAMMFPTNDPWAYPNQPMTTLEDIHLGGVGGGNEMQDVTTGILPQSPTTAQPGQFGADGMDMQIFSMPPYLMQGQQPGMNLGLGLFDADSQGDPWAGIGKQDIDWGTWAEGNFGGGGAGGGGGGGV